MVHVKAIYDIVDNWSNDKTPHGVSVREDETQITDEAFDYFIGEYGMPRNINDARFMFEWASALQPVMQQVTYLLEKND